MQTTDAQLTLSFPGEVMTQVIIPEGKHVTPYDRWYAFHKLNPQVWSEIQRRARRILDSGGRRVSMKMIFELMRHDYMLATHGDEYKLNNNYHAYYARLLEAQSWMPDGAIETRQRRGV